MYSQNEAHPIPTPSTAPAAADNRPPETRSLRMLSLKDSFEVSFVLYKKMMWPLIAAVLIPSLITLILGIALKATSVASLARAEQFTDVLSFTRLETYILILFLVVMFVVQLMSIIAPIYLVLHHEKEDTSIVTAFERSAHYFGRFIVFGVAALALMIFSLLLGYMLYALIGIVIGWISLELLESSRAILELIPLLISTLIPLFFLFVGFSIVDHDHSAREGIRDSVRLVRGHFWALVLRLVVMYVIAAIIVYALQFLPRFGTFVTLTIVAPFTIVYISTLYRNLHELKST